MHSTLQLLLFSPMSPLLSFSLSASACWSSNLSLIPLTGPASRIFWRTLEGPEVKPVTLNFSVVMSDPRAVNFQKMMKKKFVSKDNSKHLYCVQSHQPLIVTNVECVLLTKIWTACLHVLSLVLFSFRVPCDYANTSFVYRSWTILLFPRMLQQV